jgi:integrase
VGSHLMRRPPKFVHGFIDRHGKPRFYFRRAGFKKVSLPGLPWSPGFMEAYEAAMATQPEPIGAKRTTPGTMRALAVSYFGSSEFASLRPSSQRSYRVVIEALCREHGDKRVALLRRDHVVKLMAAKSEHKKFRAANWLRLALRLLMQHAIALGMRENDPTRDVKPVRIRTEGYHSWSEAEIAQFEEKHPVGTQARLAFALLLYTGQRPADVLSMGRQHVRDGFIHLRQQKTGAALEIEVHPVLAEILATVSSGQMIFVTTVRGVPFASSSTFGHWFREHCDAAGLPHCTAHGLRKAAARRLAEVGCTEHEIAAITGHASLQEVARYTKAASQKRLASAAMTKMKGEHKVANLSEGLPIRPKS